MRYFQLGLALASIPSLVHCLETVDIGHDFKIGHQSFTHRKPGSDFQETFSCATSTGKHLVFNHNKTTAACCAPAQHLSGTHGTQFRCCGANHDLAGSHDHGYRCCPSGYSYDGKLCHAPDAGNGGHGSADGYPPDVYAEQHDGSATNNPGGAHSSAHGADPGHIGGHGSQVAQVFLGNPRGGAGGGGDQDTDGGEENGGGDGGEGGGGKHGGSGGDGHGGKGGDGEGGGHGKKPPPDWCQKPHTCHSGVDTGKCYLFEMEKGIYFGYSSKSFTYSVAKDSIEHHMGKFRFCKDKDCTPGCSVQPGEGVAILDLHGAAGIGLGVNNWLDGQVNGAHVTKTPLYEAAGNFTITKWTCGKYCLGGSQYGVGPTCPSLEPSITFNTLDPQSCVPLELVEVPCDVRDKRNNCRWQKEPGSCGTGDPEHCKCGCDD